MSGYVYRCLTIVEQAGGKPVAAGLIAELIPEVTVPAGAPRSRGRQGGHP